MNVLTGKQVRVRSSLVGLIDCKAESCPPQEQLQRSICMTYLRGLVNNNNNNNDNNNKRAELLCSSEQ